MSIPSVEPAPPGFFKILDLLFPMELPFQTLDELKNQQFESWPMQGGNKGGIKKYLQMNLIND